MTTLSKFPGKMTKLLIKAIFRSVLLIINSLNFKTFFCGTQSIYFYRRFLSSLHEECQRSFLILILTLHFSPEIFCLTLCLFYVFIILFCYCLLYRITFFIPVLYTVTMSVWCTSNQVQKKRRLPISSSYLSKDLIIYILLENMFQHFIRYVKRMYYTYGVIYLYFLWWFQVSFHFTGAF